MEDRKSEIQQLLTSFVACLQPIITRYREMRDARDVVKHFEIRVEGERARYKNKFQALRTDPSCAGLGDLIDDIERQIENVADSEIARAKADGKIEFDHLTAALRDTQRGLSNAVGKLERK
jgi:hypothetical protein